MQAEQHRGHLFCRRFEQAVAPELQQNGYFTCDLGGDPLFPGISTTLRWSVKGAQTAVLLDKHKGTVRF